MNGIGINYQEGMFLGKQELQRQNEIEDLWKRAFWEALGVQPENSNFITQGILDPRLTKLTFSFETVNSVKSLVVGFEPVSGTQMVLGSSREIVGFGTTYPIGATNKSKFIGKEGFISLASLASGTWYIALEGAVTHYENALLDVSQNGSGVITQNWDFVADLFRDARFGRQTVILTELGQKLIVTDIDESTHILTFAGSGTFTAESGSKFAFLHTISPFSNEQPNFLYTYPSMTITLQNNDESGFILGKFDWDNTGTGTESNVELFSASYQKNKYNFLGYRDEFVLEDGAVTTPKLADEAVTTSKIADANVTTPKLADNAVETAKIKDGNVTSDKLADGAVTSAKVSNNAVTEDKIQDGAVTQNKIGNGAVSTDKIANGAVDASKLDMSLQPIVQQSPNSVGIHSGTVSINDLLLHQNSQWISRILSLSSGSLSLVRTNAADALPSCFEVRFFVPIGTLIYVFGDTVPIIPSQMSDRYVKLKFTKRTDGLWDIEWTDPYTNYYAV